MQRPQFHSEYSKTMRKKLQIHMTDRAYQSFHSRSFFFAVGSPSKVVTLILVPQLPPLHPVRLAPVLPGVRGQQVSRPRVQDTQDDGSEGKKKRNSRLTIKADVYGKDPWLLVIGTLLLKM